MRKNVVVRAKSVVTLTKMVRTVHDMGCVAGTNAATGLLRMLAHRTECVFSWLVTLTVPRGWTAHLAIIGTALPFRKPAPVARAHSPRPRAPLPPYAPYGRAAAR